MGIFTAVVQARLDNSSVGVIKTQIENAVKNSNPSDIKVGVNSAFLQKEVNDALKKITINPMNIKLSGQTQIPAQIQKELDNHKFTISIKDINVAGNIANLGKNVNNAFSDSIEQQLKNGKLDSEIASMQNKLQSAIQSAYKTAGTKADGSFVDFGKTEQEINKLVGDLDFWKKEIASFSASVDTDNLKQAWIEYSNVLDQCKNKLSEMSNLSNSFASSNQVQGLGLDMSTWLEKNGEASDTLKQKVKNLQSQLSTLFGNGAVDISAFKEIENEFSLIKKEAQEFSASMESIDKANGISKLLDDTSQIDVKISSLNKTMSQFPDTSREYGKASDSLKKLEQSYGDLKQAKEDFDKSGSKADAEKLNASYEAYDEQLKITTNDVAILRQEQSKLASDSQKASAGKNFENWCKNNSKAVKVYATEIEALRKQFASIETVDDLNKFNTAVNSIQTKAIVQGNTGKTLADTFKSATTNISAFVATYASIYRVFGAIKSGINTVIELDTALVDLRKTTTMSSSELESFFNGASDIAKQYGSTTKEIIQAASDWSRLGYSSKEQAEEMAKFSSQFSTISPGMTINDSTEALTSVMKAYDVQVSEVKDIMSKINKIGNTQAVSNADISEGLKQASASFALTGTSFDQLVALFTSANEVLQDSSRVGNGLKTIAMRIRGYDEDGTELEENITSKLYDLTHVSVWADDAKTTYKELGTYMKEVAENWKNLDAQTQTKALETMFGKNRANVSPYVQKCA